MTAAEPTTGDPDLWLTRHDLVADLWSARTHLSNAMGATSNMRNDENPDRLFDGPQGADVAALLADANRAVRAALALVEQADQQNPGATGPLYGADLGPVE